MKELGLEDVCVYLMSEAKESRNSHFSVDFVGVSHALQRNSVLQTNSSSFLILPCYLVCQKAWRIIRQRIAFVIGGMRGGGGG